MMRGKRDLWATSMVNDVGPLVWGLIRGVQKASCRITAEIKLRMEKSARNFRITFGRLGEILFL